MNRRKGKRDKCKLKNKEKRHKEINGSRVKMNKENGRK